MKTKRISQTLLASAMLLAVAAPAQAVIINTADLVSVVAGVPGTFTFSSSGWDGGGLVTGSFSGTDGDVNGQLSSFDGEVSGFSMSYSGGAIVGPFALFVLVLSALGKSRSEIARTLHLSPETIKAANRTLREKLDAPTTTNDTMLMTLM